MKIISYSIIQLFNFLMKQIFLFTTVLCIIISGCSNEPFDEDVLALDATTGIIVRASTMETIASSDLKEPVVFTGNDMLWFNGTTREIRFNNNISMKAAFANVEALKFYIDDEYLFSALVNINGSSAQTINSLVFYYNAIENKYYLLGSNTEEDRGNDGPQVNNIISEWGKFINQLIKDGKYNK